MRKILWSIEKDQLLRDARGRFGIGLAECAAAIEDDRILDDLQNEFRPNQGIFILEIENYVFVVPYVFDQETIFLKTMYPSRKLMARYKGRNNDRKT
jgi:hypothetical protein